MIERTPANVVAIGRRNMLHQFDYDGRRSCAETSGTARDVAGFRSVGVMFTCEETQFRVYEASIQWMRSAPRMIESSTHLKPY